MKYSLLLLGLALSSSAAHAQTAPKISIGYIETTNSMGIGGQVAQSQSMKFTDIKVIGTWVSKDKTGRHGYLYVDDAQKDQWENKELMASVGGNLLKINNTRRWDSGETALVIDAINDDAAALLSQGNFRAPINEQLNLQWQMIDNAKIRLTTTKRGSGSLRLAPDNAQISFRLTRNGQTLDPLPVRKSKQASQPANFELLVTGARWQRDFELSRYADISQPGHYQVEVNYQLLAQNGEAPADSKNITLEFDEKFDFDVTKR